MIRSVQQGLLDDGIDVPVTKLCAWFDVPRRTVYYKPTKAAPKLDDRFVVPIKALIEEEPSFGYRTVAWLLGFNKNTVQRIFQIKGWQVRKRSIGARPRVEALPSVAQRPNETMVNRPVPRLGRQGWLVYVGFGDGRPHARVAGLASVPIRQSDDGSVRAGTRADCEVRHAWESR